MTQNNEYKYLHLVRQDCPLPPGTRVFVYCRDSGGDEQDRSVTQQIETAREYCRFHNLVLEHAYVDEARQSSNTDKRGELQKMIFEVHTRFKRINDRYKREKITRESPFGVIFWKSNRLGRDSIQATNIKTDLRLHGITIIDLVTSATTGNAMIDGLIESFQSYLDETALDEISYNARRRLANLVATRDNDPEFLQFNPDFPSTGDYLGIMPGLVPVGFKSERIQIGVYKRKTGRTAGEARIVQRIVPDPETWDRCYHAWEMRHKGASYGKIHATVRLFKNINGYKSFFCNPIYMGTLEYGDKLYEGFVQPMIPKEWFDAEQVKRKERAKKKTGEKMDPRLDPRRVGSQYLLSGLVFCGMTEGEEHPMNIEHIPAKKNSRGEYTFICTTAKNSRGQVCGKPKRISIHSVEQAVIDNLLTHVLTIANLRPIAKKLSQSLMERSSDAGIRISTAEKQLAEVQKSMNNLMDALEKMGYASHIQQRYDQGRREEAELLAELHQLKGLKVNPKQIHILSDAMLQSWIDKMRKALEGDDKPLKRRMIQQFVAKVILKQETGTLYYTFPLPDDVYMSSYRDVDLKRFELMTSTVRL